MIIIYYLFLGAMLVWAGCQSVKPAHADNVCPTVQVTILNGDWDEFDQSQSDEARAGCQRHFTPRHCLIRFEKRSYHTYRAICAIPVVAHVDFVE